MNNVIAKLHLCIFIAGFTGLFGRLITLDAFWIVYFRLLIGGALFFVYIVIKRKLKPFSLKEIMQSCLLGALLSCHLTLFYISIKLSNVSIGVVCISTISFFVALLEPLMIKAKFSVSDVGYSLLAILGVLCIFGFDPQYRLGISVGIACAFFSGLYAILNRRQASKRDNYTLIFWQMTGGFVFMSCLIPAYSALSGSLNLWFNPLDAFYLLLAGTICTAGMYLLQLQVLQKLSAFMVMLSFNLEPVYSIVLAMLMFSEYDEINYSFFIGLLFIVFSVALKTSKILHQKKKLQPNV